MVEGTIESILFMAGVCSAVVFVVTQIESYRADFHSTHFQRYTEMQKSIAHGEDDDYLIRETDEGQKIYFVEARRVHCVTTDMGLTIRISEPTHLTRIRNPEEAWPSFVIGAWRLFVRLLTWLYPYSPAQDAP